MPGKSFARRLDDWVTFASVPAYFAAWVLACRGDGLVLSAYGAIVAAGYAGGYVLELRRGHLALSADPCALGFAALGAIASLALFHVLGLWPMGLRASAGFVVQGTVIGWVAGHVAGAAVMIGGDWLLRRVFAKRIAAERQPD